MTDNETAVDTPETDGLTPCTEPADPGGPTQVQTAAEAVRRAEEELKKACAAYQSLRREATTQVRKLREKTAGDVIDGTLAMVRNHPAAGLAAAVVVGFFLGRLFRS